MNRKALFLLVYVGICAAYTQAQDQTIEQRVAVFFKQLRQRIESLFKSRVEKPAEEKEREKVKEKKELTEKEEERAKAAIAAVTLQAMRVFKPPAS